MVGVSLGYIPCFNFRGVMNQLFPAAFFLEGVSSA